ncbi:CACTA en-spm transposon protein [Cucumis melo var. makuwa]|uniref:CACTA en-spm transposon protein n=1 Tax=Cucumis melo var. makuwa TaxID=1194695 RepID=A0A5D3DLR3_CUCMM|nr:CACTA en-spm transposon protein [Cucumis melo var. makuwa]
MTSTNYWNIPHCTEWCIMESQLALEEEEMEEGASQPSVTTTPSRRVQSRLLELKLYIAANRRILMIIAPNAEKHISPYIICFSQAIGKCYSKGVSWGPKPKARKTASVNSSMTLCSQSIVELQLRAPLDQAMQQIEEQTRNHDALASEVERMRKLIEDMSRVLQGPPHDP